MDTARQIDKEVSDSEEIKHICEASPLNPNEVAVVKTKEEKVKTTINIVERLKLIKNNISVEPVLACYIMPNALSAMAIQNLNTEKACRVNLNYTIDICDALHLRLTENYTYYETNVQTLIASVQAWKNVIQTVIPLFIILFVGAWSDRTGRRKACIILPMCGELISCIGFIVNAYFFYELPLEVTALTETIFPAVTGGWFTNFIGIFSYVSDITTVENRTYRVGLVNMFMSVGYPIGSALSGLLLSLIGYYGIFLITGCLYLFGIIYGIYFLEDIKAKEIKDKSKGCLGFLREFFDISCVTETFKVVYRGTFNRRLRISLLLLAMCVIFGPYYGEMAILYLFTRYQFNWNEIQFSMWSSYCMITSFFGTMFSISLFTNHLKLDDTLLGTISCISKILSAFAYAFAKTTVEIYLAPLIEIFTGTSYIALRSLASKYVLDEEFGKLNSLFALVEAMLPLIYGPLYSRVYIATLDVLPGAVYLLGAILSLPAIFIFGWLYCQHRQDRKNENSIEMDPEKK